MHQLKLLSGLLTFSNRTRATLHSSDISLETPLLQDQQNHLKDINDGANPIFEGLLCTAHSENMLEFYAILFPPSLSKNMQLLVAKNLAASSQEKSLAWLASLRLLF